MDGAVWKMQDFRVEISLSIFALAQKFGPGLGGIQLLSGSGDKTAELFLLGHTLGRLPFFGSRGKAPVGQGIGVDSRNHRGTDPRND
jgi:hypothetical protein